MIDPSSSAAGQYPTKSLEMLEGGQWILSHNSSAPLKSLFTRPIFQGDLFSSHFRFGGGIDFFIKPFRCTCTLRSPPVINVLIAQEIDTVFSLASKRGRAAILLIGPAHTF